MDDASSVHDHILVTLPFPEPKPLIEDLRRAFPALKVLYYHIKENVGEKIVRSKDIPKDILATTTVLCTFHYFPLVEEVPRLKLIHTITAGVDHFLQDPLVTDTNITITTVSGIHGPPISEWVVMNWLVSSRCYDKTAAWQREHTWGNNKELTGTLQDHVGKRVGVLGYGSIGRQVARVAAAMGMSVLAYTRSPRPTPETRRDAGYIVSGTGDPDGTIPISWHSGSSKSSLHDFLSRDLDYLLICLPLTAQTTHLLGAQEFSLLSKSCTRTGRRPFITNISRGKILDQGALIESLHAGELGGAALDVTDPEPLPGDHPLWEAPNVHITPHASAFGVEYFGRCFDVLKENLDRMERGVELVNAYERGKGY